MRNMNAFQDRFMALLEDYRMNGTETSREAFENLFKAHVGLMDRIKELEDLRGQERFFKAQAESWKNQCSKAMELLDELGG